MKPKAYFFIILAALAFAAGCYDDDKAWDAISGHEQRIRSLENWQKTTTGNIEALRILSGDKEYITGLTPIIHGDIAVGYTITFKNHAPVTIYNGRRGEQGTAGAPGSTPDISIARGEDGNWYWTLNGKPLTDAIGKPIRANALDGSDGPDTDAILPELRNGAQLIAAGIPPSAGNLTAWTPDAVYLSTDEGTTWTKVSGKDGSDGSDTAPLFTDIDTSNPLYIIFTLADGSRFSVPCYALTAVLRRAEEARTPAAPLRTACLCPNNPLNNNA